MNRGIHRHIGRGFRRAGIAAVALLPLGCGVTPAVTEWQRLHATPAVRVLADDQSALRTIRPIELPPNSGATVRIEHSDPVMRRDGATSHVKLFRVLGQSPGTYEVRVDAWCDCPWTAILWGTQTFPIFYPAVAVLDRAGNRLMVTGDVEHLDPEWTWTTTARLRGQWRVTLAETGPYYVLVTSQRTGPADVGPLGGNIGQRLTSSPVGKIRVNVRRIG